MSCGGDAGVPRVLHWCCGRRQDRNYGGMTSGFRWMFWLAPLWLVVMLPAADRLARRGSAMAVALVLLRLSCSRRAIRRGTRGRSRGCGACGRETERESEALPRECLNLRSRASS